MSLLYEVKIVTVRVQKLMICEQLDRCLRNIIVVIVDCEINSDGDHERQL
jgi:hypothetical protein